MAYNNIGNPLQPPPISIMADGPWGQGYNTYGNIDPGFAHVAAFNNQPLDFNNQKHNPNVSAVSLGEEAQSERGRRDRDSESSRNKRSRRGRFDDFDDRDKNDGRSGRFNRQEVRSKSSDRFPKNLNKDIDLRSEINNQQALMYPEIGNMLLNSSLLNTQLGMMGGILMDQTMMSMQVLPSSMDPSLLPSLPPPPKGMEIIELKTCKLLPPAIDAPRPSLRERPLGCRTVFVGGLTENIKETAVHEVFDRCGEISSLRLSRKAFCHIRFKHEESVDAAVQLSGYRLRIDECDSDGKPNPISSVLHVDYATARDDQHDWECKQRALFRERRHQQKHGHSREKRPASPRVHHFTEAEADSVSERIKQEATFAQACSVLVSWLERGDCSKRNASSFYSMIQSTNAHVRRLLMEKATQEEKLQQVKDQVRAKTQEILQQFLQVEKVFHAASHKKAWDHFTKAQRKNIDIWKKQSQELRSVQLEEFMAETAGGDEMDCSDDEGPSNTVDNGVNEKLKEENDSLRCQVDAFNNEVAVMKSEANTLRSQVCQLQLQVDSRKPAGPVNTDVEVLRERVSQLTRELELKNDIPMPAFKTDFSRELKNGVSEDSEARLIGIIATFLHIHPFGASTDYIWSYVQKLLPLIKPNEVEDVLRKFPTVFVQEITGVGANIERKWVFTGFKPA